MNTGSILFNISQVLGLTIIHSLWQGMTVYFILRMVLAFRLSAPKRYLLSVSALFIFAGWFIYTLISEVQIYTWIVTKANDPLALPLMLAIPAGVKHLDTEATRYYYDIERYLPYLTALYATGVLYQTIRLALAYYKINLVKRSLILDEALQAKAAGYSKLLKVSRKVKVAVSKLVDVPCMTGFLKPVIMLPVTLTTLLSAEEIEAIILHEIAHIKRNDYLLNLIQQIIAVLLFFNPFAWLINSIIDRERERSVDNMVVNATNQPLAYAQALLKIEQNFRNEWQLALAATGKKHHLLNRIEFIMKTKKPTGSIRQVIFTLLIFAAATFGLAWLNPTVANGKLSVRNVKPAISKIIKTLSNPVNAVLQTQDTTVGKKTEKAAADAKSTDTARKEKSYSYNTLFGYGDPKMDSLWAAYKKHSDFINGYYKTAYYIDLKHKLYGDEKSSPVFYNNDTLRNLMTALVKLGNHMSAQYTRENEKYRLLDNEMRDLGLEVGAYYSSAGFKTLNAQLEQKYGIAADKDYYNSHDSNYEKYQAELKAKTPADVTEKIARLGEVTRQYAQFYTSNDFKASVKQIKVITDSLKWYDSRPHVKQYQDTSTNKRSFLDNLPADLRDQYIKQEQAYINNPEYKKELELYKEASDKVINFMKTPEARKRMDQWQNQLQTALGKDFNKIVRSSGNPDNQ